MGCWRWKNPIILVVNQWRKIMGKQVKKHGYSCKLVRVVDGDTADAMIDLGFNVWVKNRIRFMGVDAWESRTRNKEEKVKGLAA